MPAADPPLPLEPPQALPGLASLGPRRRAKAPRAPSQAPKTPTGETAGDIIGAWVAWFTDLTQVNVPHPITQRLGKQVKVLIESGYATNAIKMGLLAWTVERDRRPELPPEKLPDLALRMAIRNSPTAAVYVAAIQKAAREMQAITAPAVPPESSADRNWRASDQARAAWLASRSDQPGVAR